MRALIAGNWKMNTLRGDAVVLARAVVAHRRADGDPGCDVLICPPAVMLHAVAEIVADTPVALGGQDCHMADAGAHTGDVSAAMLADAGCSHVIVGHSERRADHGETDAQVRAKAMAAHRHGLCPIVCVGETLAQRDSGQALSVVAAQLAGSLPDGATASDMVIAYEPVWAIGTGRTATAPQIAEMHGHIRGILAGRMPDAAAVRLLYGGSVNRGNAAEILAVDNVDGALVGGASLKADDFGAICRSVP